MVAMGLAIASARLPAAEHEHGTSTAPGRAKVEKPVVFLDKSPRIVAYQLSRLSNEQLLLVDRDVTDRKFGPVWEAILTRSGIPVKLRQEAAEALAKLRETDVATELLGAIQGLKEGEDAGDLIALLVRQPAEVLAKNRERLTTVATESSALASARRAAFAGLLSIEEPEKVWEIAEGNEGLPHLLGAVPWVPTKGRVAALRGRIEALLAAETDEATRRGAIAAAGSIGGESETLFGRLARLIEMGIDVPQASRALLKVKNWPEQGLEKLVENLLEQAGKVPESERTGEEFLDVLQLGGELASKLPKEKGLGMRKAFRSLGVHVLRLRTIYEQMLFDKNVLVVEAGKPVELIFENPDAMQHNWVLVLPGAAEEIGSMADKMTPVLDAKGRAFVPDSAKVLEATRLLNQGEQARLRFTAPSVPDKYPYLCTFPAHWMRMRGMLLVVPDLDAYLADAPVEPDGPILTEWKASDFTDALAQISPARNLEGGKLSFQNLGCAACHQLRGEGTSYGPELTGVWDKYKGNAEKVLIEILEPSKNIEPRYQAYNFTGADGDTFTGLLVKEDADSLHIQTGPGDQSIQKVPKTQITKREPQAQSLMPGGLLNLLSKEQIIDLLSFLKHGAPSQAAQK